ncbi:hypothetical protein B3C1_15112 [Gallaecimonas xiamenensis 3-C-1]|uniref:DUF4240 domain-containing protein n=1 Tax=Gallaecimonas xiamenensis 3-C-1 TaxID=745411 RepID=K2J3I3_9GAMM|nr:hypothetical protein B3C1_15112 [Gallaecimonas xiamenensis 3-C-1]
MTLPPDEICRFDREYRLKLVQSYRWDLWGAAYLINGGCSDDGFDYFRDFLISEGKEVFESALAHPDSLSSLAELEDAELEDFRYVIGEAYEQLVGEELPIADIDYPNEPAGEEWDEDDLQELFPKLAALYE